MSSGAAGAQGSKQVNLASVSLARLLFALLHQRFSGTVMIEQPVPHAGPRTVWFRGGMPVFTDWVVPTEVLGQILIAQRVIGEPELLRGLEAMAAQGGLLGRHLIAMGLLDRPRLLDGLRVQCSRKLGQIFSLREGAAVVTLGSDSLEPDLLPINVLGLIQAGVGAVYDEARVESEMGPALRAPVQATAALSRYRSHFRFRPTDEAALAGLVRGTRVEELAGLPGLSTRRGAQLIYTLWACQMLRTGGSIPAAGGSAEISAAPAATASARPPAPVAAPAHVAASAAPRPPLAGPAPASPDAGGPSLPSAAAADPAELDEVLQAAATEGDDAFIEQLEALEAKIASGAHAFELFDLPLTASKRDVRRAWGDLSRRFHPDALRSQGRTTLNDRVNEVFAALSEANQVLADAEQRASLKEAIAKGEHEVSPDGKDATAKAHAVFQSELLAKEADKLLRATKFERALERYREAASYNPDEPDIKAAITWCEFQVAGRSPQQALLANDELSAIIEEWPNVARAHYFLGFVLAARGNPQGAISSFSRAVQIDPRLIDAERQARALRVKHAAATPVASSTSKGRRGGLRGLLGRKK